MPLFEAVRMALRTIVTQKLKSFFSLIGVLIGVTFLIAVVSIVQGMNVYMEDQFANRLIGLNTFTLRALPQLQFGQRHRRHVAGLDPASPHYLLRCRLRGGAAQDSGHHGAFCSDRMVLSYGTKQAKDIELIGTEPSYFEIKNVDIASGRIFTAQELRVGSPVLVVGSELGEKLFQGLDPWARM